MSLYDSDLDYYSWVNEHNGRSRDPEPERCFDCEEFIDSGAIYASGRMYCQECGRAREKDGILFDARPLAQIQGAV